VSVPFTRTLPYVLRRQLSRTGVRFVIGEVTAVPDPAHVTIVQGGAETVVARLASYSPTVGEPAYCLAADTLIIALGTVRGATATEGG
jgi:hypothetical protein